MYYTGEQCFSCGNTFTDDDDVVVCPDCGTPYHRQCYKSAGECINHQLHESDEGWKRSSEMNSAVGDDDTAGASSFCTKCLRIYDDPEKEKCDNCGTPLVQVKKIRTDRRSDAQEGGFAKGFEEIDLTKEYMGFNPDEDFGGATLSEVSNFVGTNTFYYIPLFKRMKDLGSKISFNMICLFFPYFYFANRKMWLWALITAFASLILNIPSMLYLIGEELSGMPYKFMQEIASFISEYDDLILSLNEICGFADFALRFCMCIFANWLYMKFILSKIRKMKRNSDMPLTPQRLRAKGGVQPLNILIIVLIILALSSGGYFAVTFLLTFLQSSGVI